MANWTNNFPSMGDSGEKPPNGQNWQGGEQVNEKHFDYLWDQIEKTVDNILAHTLQDDGSVQVENDTYLQWHGSGGGSIDALKVNTADELETSLVFNLGGDLVAPDGEVIWDESATHVPQGRLENSSLTVTAGDGVKGGGSVALGGSTTLNVEPADFAGTFLSDDGTDNLAVDTHDSLRDDGSGNIRVDETYGMNWSVEQQFSAGLDTRGDIVDDLTTVWDSSNNRIGDDVVQTASINTNAVGTDALNLSITPTWTGKHTFGSGVNISSGTLELGGATALQSVPVSGQVTLSSGTAEVDTGISTTDATFMPAVGVDDPDADTKVSARLFWDDSDGSYHIEFVETGTAVGNPTVNYDVLRVR